ncbi:MAG: helix-turn-helix domain-containing protein [Pirellulaceae bacterium]
MSTLPRRVPDARSPSASDALLARESSRQLVELIADDTVSPCHLRLEKAGGGDEMVTIPATALRLLREILTQMGEGHGVSLVPADEQLTTGQAAELLDVSHAFLVEQLDRGEIPFHQEGAQRRILLADILEYKRSMNRKRLEALDELAAQAQELDMGY